MIQVTRFDNSKIMVNVESIQSVQSTPDTVITFTNRNRILVKEPLEEVSKLIFEYQRMVRENPLLEQCVFQTVPPTIN